MAHNPYSPPSAPTELKEAPAVLPSPWQVRAAVWLIWISLAMSLGVYALEPMTPDLEEALEEEFVLVFAGIFAVVTLGLMALLSYFILRAHRWARIVYSALVVLSLTGAVAEVPETFAQSWYYGVLYLLTIAIDVATVVLLFTPPANEWFRKRREAAQS
jgi:hypothetical protein